MENRDDLGDSSLLDPSNLNDRFPFYRRLRNEQPVRFDPKLGMYLVSRYDDLQTVLRDPLTFSMERGFREHFAKGFQQQWREILEREGGGYWIDHIMSDPPTHTRVRRLLENAFTARRVKQLECRIRDIVVEVIEEAKLRGEVEAVRDIGVRITAEVLCEQLGFDRDEISPERIESWAVAVNAQMGRLQSHEEMVRYAAAICDMQNTIIRHIHDRRQHRGADMISDFVYAQIEGDPNPELEFGEVVTSVKAMIAAANDATAGMIVSVLFMLATEPDIAESFRGAVDDPRLMNRMVEELIRRESPAHATARMTTREVELGGVILPEGAHLLLMFASANYDESRFPEPGQFDPDRSNLGQHVGFGSGIHRCIGAALARMEVRVFAEEAVRRLGRVEIAVPLDELRYAPTIATRTFERLPVHLGPSTAAGDVLPERGAVPDFASPTHHPAGGGER